MNVCAVVSTAKSEVIIRGHKSSDCFEYQKNPYLNQVTPVFLQKKYRNRNFKPKNPSIIPVTWNPEYNPLPRACFPAENFA